MDQAQKATCGRQLLLDRTFEFVVTRQWVGVERGSSYPSRELREEGELG